MGFESTVEDPWIEDFALTLLETLWQQRRKNRYFLLLYEKFPWTRVPQPAFPYIRLIDWKNRSPEEEALIAQLQGQILDGLKGSVVRVTPDYLVGKVYRSMLSFLRGEPDYYCVMPLGYIHAEASLPHPNWKPVVAGHLLVEVVTSTLKTTASVEAIPLEDRYYLYVRGWDANGSPLELAFDWYGPGDDGYKEAELVVRFISAMIRRKQNDLRFL